MDRFMCWYYNENGFMNYTYVEATNDDEALELARLKDSKMCITQRFGVTYQPTATYIE